MSGASRREPRLPLYVEHDGVPVPAGIAEWSAWMVDAESNGARKVDATDVDGTHVSTVFLGVDTNWGVGVRRMLYETAVRFSDGDWDVIRRYSTRAEA